MGLFSNLFKKKVIVNTSPQDNIVFENEECRLLWELKLFMESQFQENRYIPKSEYRSRMLDYKKTIEYFSVLDNSGMIQSFCKNNRISLEDVFKTLNMYSDDEKLID